jgi:hypothetical protein
LVLAALFLVVRTMNHALTSVQTCAPVTVVRGSDLDPRQFREILAILLPKWCHTDRYLDDISRVMHNAGDDMLVRISDGQIDGVLRTKCISAGGDPCRVPATFEELVGPYWSRCDPTSDTRILVDLTKLAAASGIARTLNSSVSRQVPGAESRDVQPGRRSRPAHTFRSVRCPQTSECQTGTQLSRT